MRKTIVLDRDGVINEDSPLYIKNPDEWHPVPGSMEAIAKLHKNGFIVVIATNQSGIARGYFTWDTLNAIHKKMLDQVNKAGGHIEAIFICPHGPDDNCECRKPKPGLLLQAASQFNVECSNLLFIGDSLRDIQAAQSCGAAAIFIKTKDKDKDLLEAEKAKIPVFSSLAEAVDSICNKI